MLFNISLFVFAAVVAYVLNDVRKEVKQIRRIQTRRSYTFMGMQNRINAIHDCMIVLSKENPEVQMSIVKLKGRSRILHNHTMENGFNSFDNLTGLEDPDFENDPSFWRAKEVGRTRLKSDAEINQEILDWEHELDENKLSEGS